MLHSDDTTTIKEIKDALLRFREERDWAQFHKPKDVAAALAIEAGELQELFLWKSDQEIAEKFNNDPQYRERIEEELADVFNYCLTFANSLDLDMADLAYKKIAKSAAKYPVDKAKGVATKYTEL